MSAARCRPLRCLAAVFALAVGGVAAAAAETHVLRRGDSQLRVEIVGVDDPQRRAVLRRWVAEAADAARTASGRYPLANARVRVQEIDSRDPSAVPWGQTSRRGDVVVLLYVRRDADFDALRADWTAVHEFAHLHHPYLGDRGRWLAEGLASYWQNVLRARAGLLTQEEAWRRLDGGFQRGRRAQARGPLNALGRDGTMRTYWAGAAYWLQADLALRRDRDTTLDAVLDRYARCCLRGTAWVAPEEFAAALDGLAGGDIFMRLYRDYARSTAFPSLQASYRELGLSRGGSGLAFSGGDAAAKRRAAIMAPGSARVPAASPAP